MAVSAVELTGTRYAVYQLTVEPDLWPMKRDRNLRIFEGPDGTADCQNPAG